MERIPDEKLSFIVEILERNVNEDYEEVEPDEWDLQMMAEAELENDGTYVTIEDLAKELGIELQNSNRKSSK